MILQFLVPLFLGFVAGAASLYLTFIYMMKNGIMGIFFGKSNFVALGGSMHWTTYSFVLIPIVMLMVSVYVLRFVARITGTELGVVSYGIFGLAFVVGLIGLIVFR